MGRGRRKRTGKQEQNVAPPWTLPGWGPGDGQPSSSVWWALPPAGHCRNRPGWCGSRAARSLEGVGRALTLRVQLFPSSLNILEGPRHPTCQMGKLRAEPGKNQVLGPEGRAGSPAPSQGSARPLGPPLLAHGSGWGDGKRASILSQGTPGPGSGCP